MPTSYQRGHFLKDTDLKERNVNYKKKNLRNQEASMKVMKDGFEALTAGIKFLIDNAKKSNNDSLDTTKVKALELKSTNERINGLEIIIKELQKKIVAQDLKIETLEEKIKSKKVSKELFPTSAEKSPDKSQKSKKK